ncbi:class I SAM-dependent methyltransferase [Clostridium estertheticum]|uniref:class I SAM-dependent methyltransferase n=1 Tax=Clostridium estertheticum TaxID=238834 RepID=UPI001CF1142A|nr:class I SAM-dependent methyltransferase [Clostridium estertheticum]MCB2359372.1 class I SAM-dependent methyltransferase [Clostridium estertheticum]
MKDKLCRFCGSKLNETFVDLGMSPLSNAYIVSEKLQNKENFYPLHAYVCSKCFLVQLEEFESPEEIFRNYAYFSSFSDSWLKHAENYVNMMIERFKFDFNSQIIEVASNDGYLLQYFKKKGFSILGIEPAKNVAAEAIKNGIPTKSEFFGVRLADELIEKNIQADLLIGNNVLAHVPNLNDFVLGMKKILSPKGIITMEFPHIFRLIEANQFDTIYHEHFSYLSLTTVKQVFEKHGIIIFDVEELSTHGGSLRIYAKHIQDSTKNISENVSYIMNKEIQMRLDKIETYREFSQQVKETKRNILSFLINLKNEGKQIVGYGAPAKGNTLLNYCGIRTDFLDYTVDISPYKQGLYLPGTHIQIFSPDKIKETKPDYIVILPWNIKEEIMEQMGFIKEWGGKFVTLIPSIEVY